MTPNDLNVIKWYTSLDDQRRFHDLWQGTPYRLISSLYRFPPFDFPFEKSGANLTYFSLVSLENGSITNIISQLVNTGLIDDQMTNFDAYRYPSSTNINMGITPGQYYAVMRDSSGGEWFSEVITFTDNTTDKITLEWFHLEQFYFEGEFDGTFVKYAYPYKGRCIFNTKPGKPSYPEEITVDTRNGKRFVEQHITWKEYRFWFNAPEEILDTLRTVGQHDCKEIHYQGKKYRVDNITFDIEWVGAGNIAYVECVFTTDTVVVVNGRATSNKIYVADPGTCVNIAYTARGEMTEAATDYINRTFQGSPMEDGDIFVIVDGALDKVAKAYDLSGDQFVTLAIATKAVVYVEDSGAYYFQSGTLKTTEITDILTSPYRAEGTTFSNVQIEIWTKDDFGNEYLAGVGSDSDFEGAGIEFSPRTQDTFVMARVSSTRCNEFNQTGWIPFDEDGIGFMIIDGGSPQNRVG